MWQTSSPTSGPQNVSPWKLQPIKHRQIESLVGCQCEVVKQGLLEPHMYIYVYIYVCVCVSKNNFFQSFPARRFLLSLPSLDGTQGRQTWKVLFQVLFAAYHLTKTWNWCSPKWRKTIKAGNNGLNLLRTLEDTKVNSDDLAVAENGGCEKWKILRTIKRIWTIFANVLVATSFLFAWAGV